MAIRLYHDLPACDSYFQSFLRHDVLARLKALDARIERKGLKSLDPGRNPLIPLGTEIDARGRVTKNSYGVFHLSWRAAKQRDWHERIGTELEEIRSQIRQRHGMRLRFLIWAGMGGSAEDKSMYNATGLLGSRPRCYVLDSADPVKLEAILGDMQRRSGQSLDQCLKSTLVAGMAMGMTSYEPVLNLERIASLYDGRRIDSRPNVIYMTLTGSLLDQFAGQRGYRRVELQLDGGDNTAGRHSGPLTRGSLYPLGLSGVDLREWIEGTFLDDEQIDEAWRLASFLHAQSVEGRDKVTLLLPRKMEGAALWTKQNFEESLGKSEKIGIKIVVGEKPRLANYRPPRDPHQDRLFLAFQARGPGRTVEGPDANKLALLRRSGYPLAVVTAGRGAVLSSYMQFIHYAVFGLAWLRGMNFVTQPGVELYKSIANRLHAQAARAGGIDKTQEWQKMKDPSCSFRYRGGLSLHTPHTAALVSEPTRDAAKAYAQLLERLVRSRKVEYGELTFFGDTRYSPQGRAVRASLERAAEAVFRAKLKVPVDVYEGPAMNHSYHEMIIGHGRCFSTVLMSEKQAMSGEASYHASQFLATQLALAERGRAVAAILLKDLDEGSVAAMGEFFRQVARNLC